LKYHHAGISIALTNFATVLYQNRRKFFRRSALSVHHNAAKESAPCLIRCKFTPQLQHFVLQNFNVAATTVSPNGRAVATMTL